MSTTGTIVSGREAFSQTSTVARRPRWRAYLLLSRVSNVPTVWTNVLAGMIAASAVVDWSRFGRVAVAASLFYTAGMFLNDACDERFDRTARPDRPIPRGDVTRSEVFAVGAALLTAGEILLAPVAAALLLGLGLTAAILLYDYRHKGSRVAPAVMGLCRGLVYCIGAAAASGITGTALAGAAMMALYVAGLTGVARMAGANARWLVPALIAGISLVDALFVVAVSGSTPLAVLAASGFPLTLFLQRFVPGD